MGGVSPLLPPLSLWSWRCFLFSQTALLPFSINPANDVFFPRQDKKSCLLFPSFSLILDFGETLRLLIRDLLSAWQNSPDYLYGGMIPPPCRTWWTLLSQMNRMIFSPRWQTFLPFLTLWNYFFFLIFCLKYSPFPL